MTDSLWTAEFRAQVLRAQWWVVAEEVAAGFEPTPDDGGGA